MSQPAPEHKTLNAARGAAASHGPERLQEGMLAVGAVCPHGSAAREQSVARGDGSTGTEKTWQSTGNGGAGHAGGRFPAARSSGPRRNLLTADPDGLRPVSRAGTGDGPQSGQTV